MNFFRTLIPSLLLLGSSAAFATTPSTVNIGLVTGSANDASTVTIQKVTVTPNNAPSISKVVTNAQFPQAETHLTAIPKAFQIVKKNANGELNGTLTVSFTAQLNNLPSENQVTASLPIQIKDGRITNMAAPISPIWSPFHKAWCAFQTQSTSSNPVLNTISIICSSDWSR